MEDTRKTPPPPGHTEEENLMTLVELQKFLADELASSEGGENYSRAFLPLTDGLGLDSPIRKTEPFAPEAKVPKATPPPVPPSRKEEIFSSFYEPEEQVPVQATPRPSVKPEPIVEKPVSPPEIKARERVIETRHSDAHTSPAVTESQEIDYPEIVPLMPPPVPGVSLFRRLFAGIMDEGFVLLLVAVALLITSKTLSPRSSAPLAVQLVTDFSKPIFLRFALLEFATVWLAYFAIGIGVLDMTFGMWVWGMRVGYGGSSGDTHLLRKMLRVLWSFLFTPQSFQPCFSSSGYGERI